MAPTRKTYRAPQKTAAGPLSPLRSALRPFIEFVQFSEARDIPNVGEDEPDGLFEWGAPADFEVNDFRSLGDGISVHSGGLVKPYVFDEESREEDVIEFKAEGDFLVPVPRARQITFLRRGEKPIEIELPSGLHAFVRRRYILSMQNSEFGLDMFRRVRAVGWGAPFIMFFQVREGGASSNVDPIVFLNRPAGIEITGGGFDDEITGGWGDYFKHFFAGTAGSAGEGPKYDVWMLDILKVYQDFAVQFEAEGNPAIRLRFAFKSTLGGEDTPLFFGKTRAVIYDPGSQIFLESYEDPEPDVISFDDVLDALLLPGGAVVDMIEHDFSVSPISPLGLANNFDWFWDFLNQPVAIQQFESIT